MADRMGVIVTQNPRPALPRRTVGGKQRGRVDLEMVGGPRRDIGSGYRGLYPLALSRQDAAALFRMGA